MDNLSPLILPLIKRWKWLLIATLLAALFAWLISLILPPSYEVTVPIAIVRAQTQVSLDGTVESTLVSDDRVIDARRSALVALVKNSDIADMVRRRASDSLSLEITVNQLLNLVVANSNGDLINIAVTYGDADIARRLAAIWADEYVAYINRLYNLDSDADLQLIRSQTELAEQNYLATQNALETFLLGNELSPLQREVDTTILLIASYEEARRVTLVTPVELGATNTHLTLESLYAELVELETVFASATAIRANIEASGDFEISSTGIALTLLSLENQIFGGGNPLELSIDPLSENLNRLTLSDIQAFIDVLEVKRSIILRQIEDLSTQASLVSSESISRDSDYDEIISDLESELRTLQANLESESNQLLILQTERDTAMSILQTMRSAQLQAELQAQTPRVEVKRATVGTPPAHRAGLNNRIIVIMAAIFGMGSAAAYVLIQDMYLQSQAPADE